MLLALWTPRCQRRRRTGARLLAVSLAGACALTACGGDGNGDAKGSAVVTVYSSMPLHGEARAQSQDVVRGIRMAVRKVDGRAGKFRIRHVSLDNSTTASEGWDITATSSNARKAVADDSAIGYIGELDGAATAITLAMLNEAGILQISPTNTYIGFTRAEGAGEGEPDKFYPSGRRTYGRVIPADHTLAVAFVSYMRTQKCTSVYLLDNPVVHGIGLAKLVETVAERQDVQVKGYEGIDTKEADFRSVAARIKSSEADCFFFAGPAEGQAVELLEDVFVANPGIKLFGPSDVARLVLTKRLGSLAENRTFIVTPTLPPSEYPPAARAFYRTFKARYGRRPKSYAIYGYEAMAVLLDAIKRAGDRGDERAAVVDAFFQTRNRRSVLGRYNIDENGDTTRTKIGGYTIRDGASVFDRVIDAGS